MVFSPPTLVPGERFPANDRQILTRLENKIEFF